MNPLLRNTRSVMSQDFDPLEKVIGEELRKLAPIKAPAALSQNVLAQIRAAPSLPWWEQSIWSWPPLARATFLFIALALMLTVLGGSWVATPEVQSSFQGTAEKLSAFSALLTALSAIGGWLLTLWERSLLPWLPYIIAVAATAYLLCLGLGTAVVRYVSRQT
jgi:hypothetical protein